MTWRRGIAVCGVALVSACASLSPTRAPDDSGVTQLLELSLLRAMATPTFVADSGMPATFTNHGTAPLIFHGVGCGGRAAIIDRWTGVWATMTGPPNPCGVPATGVAAGASAAILGLAVVRLDPGFYRLRMPTSVGDAISPSFAVR